MTVKKFKPKRNVKNNSKSRLNDKMLITERMRKNLAIKQGDKKICLTMIVKNESSNMNRLLDSVKEIIDMISIVDTGSTDNTKEIIIEWGTTNRIPTTVHEEPFVNFAYSRTHSIRKAKETYPEADYFLLSDADFVWNINVGHTFDKKLLIDHKYLVEQYNPRLAYWNIRLLSSKVDWECVGVTHEYWKECDIQSSYDNDIRTNKIRTLRIDDREDGGCKSDKFERDERLLKEGLNDENTPPDLKTRYKFYLAQTLKDLQRPEESIYWYTERIKDKGWDEEVYHAKYSMGVNYERMCVGYKNCIRLLTKKEEWSDGEKEYFNKWNSKNYDMSELVVQAGHAFKQTEINYMAAYKFRKSRAEALYHLTRFYREMGKNEHAYELALIGVKIPPSNDTLFVETPCYDYLFKYELSIVAFYVEGARDIGRQYCSELLERNDLPYYYRAGIEHSSRFYT